MLSNKIIDDYGDVVVKKIQQHFKRRLVSIFASKASLSVYQFHSNNKKML